jgi:hypothetical protein
MREACSKYVKYLVERVKSSELGVEAALWRMIGYATATLEEMLD